MVEVVEVYDKLDIGNLGDLRDIRGGDAYARVAAEAVNKTEGHPSLDAFLLSLTSPESPNGLCPDFPPRCPQRRHTGH